MAKEPIKRIILKNVRLSYVNLFEPYQFEGEQEAKFRCDVLISKNDEVQVKQLKQSILDLIKESQENGILAKKDLSAAKKTNKWHNPLKDGDIDKPNDTAYKNCYYLSLRSNIAPNIIDMHKNYVTKDQPDSSNKIYSGVYVNISVIFRCFDKLGKLGVSSFLGNILTLEKGERLDGGMSAEEEFANDFESNESNVLEVDGEDLF